MLILTRNVGESIDIIPPDGSVSGTTRVTFLGMKGRQIRLGINAPNNVTVHREEVTERIRIEREEGRKL